MDARMAPETEKLAAIFGPLTPAEERGAIDAAVTHLKGRRIRIYGAELRVEKPPRRGSDRAFPRRLVTVLAADVAEYLPFEIVVEPGGRVVEAIERPDRVPPFSDEEIHSAVAVARAHPELAETAERWEVQPAPFYPSAHAHGAEQERPKVGRRRVGLHFLDASDPLDVRPIVTTVVDLTTGEVESIERHPNRPGPPG